MTTEGEIEVTPEMIKAGCDAYALYDSGDRADWVVWAVYTAMARVRQSGIVEADK